MLTKEMFLNPFVSLWNGVIAILPKLIVAIIVFIFGWIVAKLVYKLIIKIGKSLKIDELVNPLLSSFEKAGYKISFSRIIAFLVKWFVIIGTLVVSLDILGLGATKLLLIGLVAYIPRVIIAVIVLIAGLALANFTKKVVQGSTKAFHVKSASFLANLVRVTLIVFTVLMVLDIIGFSSAIIQILFIGIVAMVALAGGLAFGLGGQKVASEVLEEIKETMTK